MITKMKELCEQRWCSQMVANSKVCGSADIASCLRERYRFIFDCTQHWGSSPQGRGYWSPINNAWSSNHPE